MSNRSEIVLQFTMSFILSLGLLGLTVCRQRLQSWPKVLKTLLIFVFSSASGRDKSTMFSPPFNPSPPRTVLPFIQPYILALVQGLNEGKTWDLSIQFTREQEKKHVPRRLARNVCKSEIMISDVCSSKANWQHWYRRCPPLQSLLQLHVHMV